MRTKALLLTCPAYVTASLLASCQTPNAYVAKGLKRAAQALTSVHYPPIASVVMSYPDSALKVRNKVPTLQEQACMHHTLLTHFLSAYPACRCCFAAGAPGRVRPPDSPPGEGAESGNYLGQHFIQGQSLLLLLHCSVDAS